MCCIEKNLETTVKAIITESAVCLSEGVKKYIYVNVPLRCIDVSNRRALLSEVYKTWVAENEIMDGT